MAGTVVAKRELPLARALARSWREHHPERPFVVLLSDGLEDRVDPAAEPFELITLEELEVPGRDRLAFRYGRLALSHALTPWLLAELLDRGAGRALFIKQESLVVGPMAPVLDALGTSSIALTPHLLTPPGGADAVARELEVLRAGTINGGVVGVSSGATPGLPRLVEDPAGAPLPPPRVDAGMHWEQRWLDLVPALFGDVALVRDPGANIGHWNLAERHVEVRGAQVLVDGQPASLVRFSGHDPDTPEALTQPCRPARGRRRRRRRAAVRALPVGPRGRGPRAGADLAVRLRPLR